VHLYLTGNAWVVVVVVVVDVGSGVGGADSGPAPVLSDSVPGWLMPLALVMHEITPDGMSVLLKAAALDLLKQTEAIDESAVCGGPYLPVDGSVVRHGARRITTVCTRYLTGRAVVIRVISQGVCVRVQVEFVLVRAGVDEAKPQRKVLKVTTHACVLSLHALCGFVCGLTGLFRWLAAAKPRRRSI
jgi:hypothetical protein